LRPNNSYPSEHPFDLSSDLSSDHPSGRCRYCCIRVPDILLASEFRAHPELAKRPSVVASGPGSGAEIVSVSRLAARQGVRRGASTAQARMMCAELCVRIASPALERAARDALLDVALSFSPRAAAAKRASGAYANEAAVFLDASGVSALFHSERGFASALAARAAQLGLAGDVVIASSRNAALIAARQLSVISSSVSQESPEPSGGEIRILEAGSEQRFLAKLPIDTLDPSDALAETFTRFGVQTVRDLLALPRRSLAARLGPEAMQLVALVRGERAEEPLPEPDLTLLTEAIDLDYAIDRLEPLSFVVKGLLSRLRERLEARRLACGDLHLEFDVEDGSRDARRVGVTAPTLDLRVLMRLINHALETRPPEGPVVGVCLETEGRPVQRDQLDLFRPAGPAPTVLGNTLTELEALCGSGRVGAPRIADDHRPDAFGIGPFQPGPGAASQNDGRHAQSENAEDTAAVHPLALRALRPPLTAQVVLRGGQPQSIRSGIVNGRVLRAAGPWRTTGGWWSQEGRFAYDSFDILTSDGIVSRLRYDHVHKTWQIDAVYD